MMARAEWNEPDSLQGFEVLLDVARAQAAAADVDVEPLLDAACGLGDPQVALRAAADVARFGPVDDIESVLAAGLLAVAYARLDDGEVRRRRAARERSCPICGARFVPVSAKVRYCSPRCVKKSKPQPRQ